MNTEGVVYPLFVPPAHLADDVPSNWTKAQAEEYLTWFVESIPNRLQILSEFCQEDYVWIDPEGTIERFGKCVWEALQDPYFVNPSRGRRTLTDEGYALSADMGILLASALIRASGEELRWVLGEGPVNYVGHNQPVLTGFSYVDFVPIQVSLSQVFRILRGGDADVWLNTFKYWRSAIAP